MRRLLRSFVPGMAVLGVLGAAGAAHGQFSFASFPNSTGLTLVGSAAISTTNSRLRVTPSTNSQVGAAWYTTKQLVRGGFTTTFVININTQANGGADGMAFVIQGSAANAIGDTAGGCELGYHGIPKSLAIEFDTYQSGSCVAGGVNDPAANHVSVHTRGTLPNSAVEAVSLGLSTAVTTFDNGSNHTCRVDYAPGQMTIYLDNLTTPILTFPIDLAAHLGLTDGTAWVGFTGATGGAREAHDVVSWSFTPSADPAPSNRPATPSISEPGTPGQELNPADVHMVTDPMVSPVGAGHRCSDWEIWQSNPLVRVWHADCVQSVLAVHIHLGDGVFEGPLVGRTTLAYGTNYVLRVRHRDDSGVAATEYSYWATRPFTASTLDAQSPLSSDDFLASPAPRWTLDAGGAPVALPAGATLELGSAAGQPLTRFTGTGSGTSVTDFADLGAHVPVRVKIAAPAATPVSVGASTLRIVEHDCTVHTVYLPAVSLAAGATQYLWVTSSGSTYVGAAADAAPVFGTLARGTDSPYEVREPGFVVERFATGLQLPTNIAFVPNPGPNPSDVLMYVTELYGQIKMITRDGTVGTYASGLLNFNPTGAFPGSGEVGLAGITVEPATGDLFCTLLYQFDTSTSPLRPKIIRLHSSDGGRTMATSTLVRDFPTEPQGQSHQISSITIGPDGKLYVHMGDGFTAANALDLNSARGKILRMNLDGSIPTDNPRYNAADGLTATDLIWCYGLRNPFGGCWRTSDGQHFTVENGPSVDRLSRSVANTSYGYTGSDASMAINALYNWNPAHAPVNIAFQQLSTFGGSGFPAATLDQAFVTESGPTYGSGPQLLGKRIVHFALAPSTGTVQSGPATLLEYTGVGQGSCVGLAFGPDGLYFTDLYKDLNAATPIDRGANVWRVRYVGPNAGCAVCAADYNGVNGVDLLDIFAFLNDWFAMNPRADFNGQNGVDLIDIFAFLTAWFTGC